MKNEHIQSTVYPIEFAANATSDKTKMDEKSGRTYDKRENSSKVDNEAFHRESDTIDTVKKIKHSTKRGGMMHCHTAAFLFFNGG